MMMMMMMMMMAPSPNWCMRLSPAASTRPYCVGLLAGVGLRKKTTDKLLAPTFYGLVSGKLV